MGLLSFKERASAAQAIVACRVERAQLMHGVSILPWQEALALIASEA